MQGTYRQCSSYDWLHQNLSEAETASGITCTLYQSTQKRKSIKPLGILLEHKDETQKQHMKDVFIYGLKSKEYIHDDLVNSTEARRQQLVAETELHRDV